MPFTGTCALRDLNMISILPQCIHALPASHHIPQQTRIKKQISFTVLRTKPFKISQSDRRGSQIDRGDTLYLNTVQQGNQTVEYLSINYVP